MTNLFQNNLPKLDLHGEDSVTAVILAKEFINDNYKIGNYELVIIHGIGKGILKKEVHKMLKSDKRVEKFATDYFNLGCTLVKLSVKVDNFKKKCYNTRHNLKGGI